MKQFNHIYQQYYPALYRYAQNMLHDKDLTEEILQQVFIYFWEKLSEKHTISYPKSWLYKAVYNKCSEHFKNITVQADLDAVVGLDETSLAIEKTEDKQLLNRALNNLASYERSLLILYSEGLSYKEMSEVLDIKFTSIGKTLARTLKKMEVELKKQGYEMFV